MKVESHIFAARNARRMLLGYRDRYAVTEAVVDDGLTRGVHDGICC
jgi:hypothetical protein